MYVHGWFKAPRDGEYKFYVASDDSIKLFLNKNHGDTNPENRELIA